MENTENIPILYKSNNFLVVNKQHDVKVNSDDPADEVTVETQLRALHPECVDHSVQHGFRFVHRLDYATSGVLCLALTKAGAQWGSKLMQQRKTHKHYLALVRGHVGSAEDREQVVSVAIGRDSSVTDIHKMCCADAAACENPRAAETRVVLLQHGCYDGDPASKLLLIPVTGRTHQLRVHCRHLGHQIVGDYMYSGRSDTKPKRMMLHAYRLVMPMTQEPLDVVTVDPFTPEADPAWIPTKTFATYESYDETPSSGAER